jgi:hypothetical protein
MDNKMNEIEILKITLYEPMKQKTYSTLFCLVTEDMTGKLNENDYFSGLIIRIPNPGLKLSSLTLTKLKDGKSTFAINILLIFLGEKSFHVQWIQLISIENRVCHLNPFGKSLLPSVVYKGR